MAFEIAYLKGMNRADSYHGHGQTCSNQQAG